MFNRESKIIVKRMVPTLFAIGNENVREVAMLSRISNVVRFVGSASRRLVVSKREPFSLYSIYRLHYFLSFIRFDLCLFCGFAFVSRFAFSFLFIIR